MSKPTLRKLMRRHGAINKETGEKVVVEAGKKVTLPIKYKGTTLMVKVAQGQAINPKKEYQRQLGINPKKLKKLRAKRLKAQRKNNNVKT